MQLEDRIALITGGARGLGKGIALVLAERGADIAVCDINLDGAQQTAGHIAAIGREATAYEVDVTSQSHLREIVDAALADFGRIDILVNAAGVIGAAGFEETTTSREEDWDLTFDVNVKGTALASDAVKFAHEGAALRQDREHCLARGTGWRGGWGRLWRFQSRGHSPYSVLCDGPCAVRHKCKCDLSWKHLDANVGTNRCPRGSGTDLSSSNLHRERYLMRRLRSGARLAESRRRKTSARRLHSSLQMTLSTSPGSR